MNNRSGYTNNTVIVSNLLAADAIHVHFRQQLTEPQLAKLKDVAGITSVRMTSNSYGADILVGRPHYGISIGCARAFGFDELAAQIVLVVIDALGISLDNLDLRVEDGGLRTEQDSSAIMATMRKLRQPATPRNPFYEGAATLDDIKPGVELLMVRVLNGGSAPSVLQVNIGSLPYHCNLANCLVAQSLPYHHFFLGDGGVVPLTSGKWHETFITIVNTPENRRKLVLWLLEKGTAVAIKSASDIFGKYPDDFTAQVVIKDGRLFGQVN